MTYQENCNNLDGSRRVDYPIKLLKRKLDEVLDSVPPNKECEVHDRELTHE